MAVKTPSKGWIVKHGLTVTPTTNLANVKSVRVKPGAREMIKATTHDTVATDDYVPRPLRDSAELEIVIDWDPDDAGHEAIRLAHATTPAVPYYFTPIAPNSGAAQYALTGIITGFEPGDMDAETGLMQATITYKATAAEVFTQ